MATQEFSVWRKEAQDRVDSALERFLPAQDSSLDDLNQAMRYSVLGGGKRLRPLLTFAASQIVAAPREDVERVAAAVELIHAYSLVHDDLPCMDDDSLRRGKPTTHVRFGDAVAVLAGDALQSLAFDILSRGDFQAGAAAQVKIIHELSRGALGMCGGQAIDMAGKVETLEDLEKMHLLKTGALIRSAILMGVHCGTPLAAADLRRMEEFAGTVGLAFQVMDDLLDVRESSVSLGKTAGKDREQRKMTYVTLLGVDAALQAAERLHAKARKELEPFGERALRLHEITEIIFVRQN